MLLTFDDPTGVHKAKQYHLEGHTFDLSNSSVKPVGNSGCAHCIVGFSTLHSVFFFCIINDPGILYCKKGQVVCCSEQSQSLCAAERSCF